MTKQNDLQRESLASTVCCLCGRANTVDIYYLDLYLYSLPDDHHVWAHKACAELVNLKPYSRR